MFIGISFMPASVASRDSSAAVCVNLSGRAKLEPEPVGVVEQRLQLLARHKVAEPTADLGGERELAVREGASAAPPGHDVAGLAAHTGASPRRTAALVDAVSLFEHQDVGDPRARKLERREDTGRAGADDDYLKML
jgi:hypothetical protein